MKHWFKSMRKPCAWCAGAFLLTLFAWAISWIFWDMPAQRQFLNIFGWQPIAFAPLTDALIAFLLPLVVIGISNFFQDANAPDIEYIIPWGCGALASLFGMTLQWAFGSYGYILPLVGILVALLLLLFKTANLFTTVATLTGFISTSLFASGLVHGWLFPWALIVTLLIKWFIVPWYLKGFEPREKPVGVG